ncbi:MAG: hypothetical protein E6593_07630 [Clostridium sp.]|nr:hypothetical protein [Clostridium sp.]
MTDPLVNVLIGGFVLWKAQFGFTKSRSADFSGQQSGFLKAFNTRIGFFIYCFLEYQYPAARCDQPRSIKYSGGLIRFVRRCPISVQICL